MLKDTYYCHLQQLTVIGYWTRFFKNYFQKVVYKTGEFLGNFENKILKTKPAEEVIILLEKEKKY